MLLAFAGNWDATAVGTLALAVVTGVSLLFGWASLKQAQREIELSRREVEEAHRPVVMPILRGTPMDLGSDGQPATTPQLIRSGDLVVPVENIGSGPALNLEATMTYYDDSGPSSIARGPQTPAAVTGLAVSAFAPLYLDAEGWNGDFLLSIEYEDVAGKTWLTQGRFLRAANRYVDLLLPADRLVRRKQSASRLEAPEAIALRAACPTRSPRQPHAPRPSPPGLAVLGLPHQQHREAGAT